MCLSVRHYKQGECITFRSTKGEFGALSNMAPNFPIYINQTELKTSEALYQALRFPNHPEVQHQIILYKSPISAKKYGRQYTDLTRADWNQVRFKIMKFCIELKLFQNFDRFSEVLLSTGDYPIVEYSDKDKVWGATFQNGYYVGTNALGRYLMELREKVRSKNFELTVPDILDMKILSQLIDSHSVTSYPENSILEQTKLF